MDYLKEIMRILQWATVEEAYLVLRFAKNVVASRERTEKGGQDRPSIQ